MNSSIHKLDSKKLSNEQIKYLNILIKDCLAGKRITNLHINSLDTCILFKQYITEYICKNSKLLSKELNRLNTLIYLLQEKESIIKLSNKELITLNINLHSERVI